MNQIHPYICSVFPVSFAPFFHKVLYLGNSERSVLLHTGVSLRNMVLPFSFILSAWIMIAIVRTWKNAAIITVFVVSIFSSLYFANKFLFFSERQFIFPETPLIVKLQEVAGIDRIWSYGNAYIDKNFLSYFGLYSPEGYAPFFSSEYAKLLNTIRTNGKWTDEVNRADVDLSPASEKDKLMDNFYRMRMMQILGVSYIIESKIGPDKEKLSIEERFPQESFSLVWENDLWRIWKFLLASPRIHIVSHYVVEKDPQKAIDILFDKTFDPSSSVILEKDPLFLGMEKEEGESKMIIKNYLPTQIDVYIQSTQSGILVISDTFDADWKVRVDGEKAEIQKANLALRGVPFSKGSHEVTFYYDSWSIRFGIILSVIPLGGAIGFFIFYEKH